VSGARRVVAGPEGGRRPPAGPALNSYGKFSRLPLAGAVDVAHAVLTQS
jgi:hypothetical protein